MLSHLAYLALLLGLASSLSIPTKKSGSSTSLNLRTSPHHVPVSKLRHSQSKRGYKRDALNSTLIRPTNSNLQYAIEVKFNGIPRYLLLDTGSSDTYMFAEDFNCKTANGTSVPVSQCNIGQPYTGEDLDWIPGRTLDIYYGNDEKTTGPMGYADVSLAGLSIENQQVALVNNGYWMGDGVISGTVGLGSRGLTSSFAHGSDVPILYSPVFESLYNKTGQIDPLFSIALQRGDAGGYLAFGGLPPIDFEPEFVSTKMLGVPFETEGFTRDFYAVQSPGVTLNGNTVNNESFLAVVDSGTYVNRFPTVTADAINAAFNPPATYLASEGFYVTTCNATVPQLGVTIAGTTFYLDSTDMWLTNPGIDGLCATSIARGFDLPTSLYPDGLYILGDVFLHNVVAVFDAGNSLIHFAPHTNY